MNNQTKTVGQTQSNKLQDNSSDKESEKQSENQSGDEIH